MAFPSMYGRFLSHLWGKAPSVGEAERGLIRYPEVHSGIIRDPDPLAGRFIIEHQAHTDTVTSKY